jgi:hypothetical protein
MADGYGRPRECYTANLPDDFGKIGARKMGGIGSGRGNKGGKDTTSAHRSLDARYLQREGLLTPGRSCVLTLIRNGETESSIGLRTEAGRVILTYRHQSGGSDWRPMEYPVRLDWTPCTFGGERAWFLCPADGCGQRVARLYVGGAGIFACRHCYQLAYACQRETADDRAGRRADKIRDRLGWEPGILNGPGGKPKGMHWRTFERLTAQHEAFVGVSLAWIATRLRLLERLGVVDRELHGLLADLPGEC